MSDWLPVALTVLSAACWAGGAAFAVRQPLTQIGLWAMLPACWVLDVPDMLASLPSDSVRRFLAEREYLDWLALILSFEALLGIALVWSAVLGEGRRARWLLALPWLSAMLLLLLLAQLALSRGPRWDLAVLAWSGLALAVSGMSLVAWAVWRGLRRYRAELLELILLARVLSLLGIAVLVGGSRPAELPGLAFDADAFWSLMVAAGAVLALGYFRETRRKGT